MYITNIISIYEIIIIKNNQFIICNNLELKKLFHRLYTNVDYSNKIFSLLFLLLSYFSF